MPTRTMRVRKHKCSVLVQHTHLSASPGDPFSLAGWPAGPSERAKNELAEMVETGSHEVVPIPAFDIHDNLIPPAAYEATLKGAIAHVKATILYQYLHGQRSDNFYAEIQEINVIRPPVVEAVSASKKRVQDALKNARQAGKGKGSKATSSMGAPAKRAKRSAN